MGDFGKQPLCFSGLGSTKNRLNTCSSGLHSPWGILGSLISRCIAFLGPCAATEVYERLTTRRWDFCFPRIWAPTSRTCATRSHNESQGWCSTTRLTPEVKNWIPCSLLPPPLAPGFRACSKHIPQTNTFILRHRALAPARNKWSWVSHL